MKKHTEVKKLLKSLENLADFVDDAKVGQAFTRLLETSQTVIVFHAEDDEDSPFSITALVEDQGATVTRGTFLEATLAALGVEGSKKCSRCKEELPLSQFHRDKTRDQGRATRCKVCERTRVAAWKRVQTKIKRTGGEISPGAPSTEPVPSTSSEPNLN